MVEKQDITLSEAIRLGSMACGKATYARHAPDGSRCALGAAEFAVGITDYFHCDKTQRRWPILNETRKHPVEGLLVSVTGIISSLNNGILSIVPFEPWSRERIADLVARYEAEQSAMNKNLVAWVDPPTEKKVLQEVAG